MTISIVPFKSTVAQIVSVPTCSTFLQSQSLEDLLKLSVFAEIREFDVHSCAQACAEVGWAGEDVAKMLVPHELVSLVFEQLLNLKEQAVSVSCSSVQTLSSIKLNLWTFRFRKMDLLSFGPIRFEQSDISTVVK